MKLNKKIWNGVEHPFTFQESQDPTTGVKKYIMRGMMMPKGQISRNGVLYNWESVNDKHKLLVGKPVMYNHHVDGANDKSYGHYTDSLIIENEDSIPGGWD